MDDPRTHAYVLNEIKHIPMQLWNILCPRTFKGFTLYLKNIKKWREGLNNRIKIRNMQKKYNLPLRPNQSMRDVIISIRVVELRRKRKGNDGNTRSN
ncbi:hypothetical protein LCGC14_2070170 [marine sediment metagenome]|uniref:Uncharacterized protein n=1 Tax=marine sediment metagenome TaxID=412755 RepID=A0A0F9EIT5_9ZZZZ